MKEEVRKLCLDSLKRQRVKFSGWNDLVDDNLQLVSFYVSTTEKLYENEFEKVLDIGTLNRCYVIYKRVKGLPLPHRYYFIPIKEVEEFKEHCEDIKQLFKRTYHYLQSNDPLVEQAIFELTYGTRGIDLSISESAEYGSSEEGGARFEHVINSIGEELSKVFQREEIQGEGLIEKDLFIDLLRIKIDLSNKAARLTTEY